MWLLRLRIRFIHEVDEAHDVLVLLVVDVEVLGEHVHLFLFAFLAFDVHVDIELVC